MASTVSFGQSFIAGIACWATFVGLSRIIVHFKPMTTFYLLLIYATGLLTTCVLFADLNINGGQHPAVSIVWVLAGISTDLSLILIYHIRCSCVFATNRVHSNILKAVTTVWFITVASCFLLVLAEQLYTLFVPNGVWKPQFPTHVFPILDTIIPLYLCISESLLNF
jgi:hypothetical protein